MTINILFFSITIKQREISLEEELHNQQVEKLYEQNQMRISTFLGNH
ncbi:YrzI family small protein [Caldibacillus thermoamylovorans]|nr:YrzI family small protein [Caldibacillus thermoamylovorans]MCM3477748.1 YrzI family small protein [Caldibacillus thermoamylovorans]